MARHPPLRTRVRELSTMPVTLWRRLVGWLGFLLAGVAFWLPGAVVATVLAAVLGLWLWTGSSDSVSQVVALARPWVPALQTLEMDDAEASLREGGQFKGVRWTDGQGLTVSVSQLELAWDFLPLIKAQPVTIALKARQIDIDDQAAASPGPPMPPETLALPMSVQLRFDIARLTLTSGAAPVDITHIEGDYLYDGEDEEARHRLQDLRLEVAQGRYRVDGTLQALPPMTLSAEVQASLKGQLPALGESPAQPWQGRLQADVAGELAPTSEPTHARLQLKAALHDETVGARATRPGLTASATLKPWQRQPIHALDAQVKHLNLAAFWPQLPSTLLSGQVKALPENTSPGSSPASVDSWHLDLTLSNAASGAWDLGQLPLSGLQVQATASLQAVDVTQLKAQIGPGQLQGRGHWQTGQTTAQADLTVTAVPLHHVHTLLRPALVSGRVGLRPQTLPKPEPGLATALSVDLATQPAPRDPKDRTTDRSRRQLDLQSVKVQGLWTGTQLQFSEFRLRAADAELKAQGSIHPQPLALEGQLRLQVPGLELQTKGHLSAEQGLGQLDLQAVDLARLQQWLWSLPGAKQMESGLKLAGDARLNAQWRGGWGAAAGPSIQARLQSDRLSLQNSPNSQPVLAQALVLTWDGSTQSARLGAEGKLSVGQLTARLDVQAQATQPTAASGQLVLDRLAVHLQQAKASQALAVDTLQPVALNWKDNQWDVGPVELEVKAVPAARPNPATGTAPSTTVATAVSRLVWQQLSLKQGILSTRGQVKQLGLDWVDAASGLMGHTGERWLSDAGLQGNLSFDGQWQVSWPLWWPAQSTPPEPTVRVELQRQQGDLQFRNPDADPASRWTAAGITRAQWVLRTQGDALHSDLEWDSRLAGQLQARFQTRLQALGGTWSLPTQSPLQGTVKATLPDLGLWSPLVAPPGWRAQGRLALDASTVGTLGQPDWRGELVASQLGLRSVVEGLEFANGRLVARLAGERIDITQLELEGAGGAQQGGTFSGTGSAHWSTNAKALPQNPQLSLQAQAKRLRLSSRADRRLTLSGDMSATLQDKLLRLRGDLKVDQALFILPDETAPSLSDDVVVRQTRAAAPEKASRVQTDLLIHIDLGRQLEVRGQGLQTRLGGKVSLVSTPSAPSLRVLGEVRTLDGSYRAYGQQLRISEGSIRFSGPYDDPGLNILAVRPSSTFRDTSEQVVGVKITGSARAPLVRLYANTSMPDSEKLARLVLGRPASGAGAEAAILQQAALALLSGNGGALDTSLAGRLGLDDISFRGSSTQADGTTQNAGVALGKRLSDRLYVVYESTLNTAMGTVSLFYDVSRRLTLRARAGEENAIDLIFTIPHD